MFGRNTGKPLKGPTMGAHSIYTALNLYEKLRKQARAHVKGAFLLLHNMKPQSKVTSPNKMLTHSDIQKKLSNSKYYIKL